MNASSSSKKGEIFYCFMALKICSMELTTAASSNSSSAMFFRVVKSSLNYETEFISFK